MYNVYIYGGGFEYNRLTSYLSKYKDEINVLGIVTTQKPIFSKFDGYCCLSVEEMKENIADYIIIAVEKWQEIAEILYSRGVSKDKIIRSSAFYNPNFDLDEYLKLKKSHVSILSNFCSGGMIYERLGLEALSPTVNMFCLENDYLEFLSDYEHYLTMDIEQFEDETYIEGTLGVEAFYQKGRIDKKVTWYFNHNVYAKDAVELWNLRRKRVNFSNIAVIMTIFTDEMACRFDALPLKKKIGIYYKDLGLKNVIAMPQWKDEQQRYIYSSGWGTAANLYMINTAYIDWIKFLNGRKDYKRFQ